VAKAIYLAFCEEGVSPAHLLARLAAVVNFDPAELYDEKHKLKPIRDIPEDIRFCIAGVSPGEFGDEYKIADRMDAVKTLAKALGMFKDRVEISGPEGGPVEVASPGARVADRLEQLRQKLTNEESGKPVAG
jgi:hypothetical protein